MLLTLIVAAGSTILSYPFATFSYWPFELFSTAVSVCYSISCLLRQSYVIHVQNEIRHEQFICACLTQFAVHVLALNASACEVWYKAGLININNCLNNDLSCSSQALIVWFYKHHCTVQSTNDLSPCFYCF